MQTTIKLESSNLSNYDVATYTQFHQEMWRMIGDFNGDINATFRISTDFMGNWEGKIDTLVDVNKVIRATVDTEKLAALDEDRDKALTRFFNGIKYGLDSFEDAEVEAAKRLDLIRKKYSGIQKYNYDRQTASTDGLINDLGSAQLIADMEMLRLSAIFARIVMVNSEFRKLYGSVSDSRSSAKLPTFAELKSEMSPIWDEAVQRIQAGYIFANNDTERSKILRFSEALNQRIKQIKDNYNRMQGAKKAAAKKSAEPQVEQGE